MSTDLTPNFDDVQSHYDLSDEFYQLFLDPSIFPLIYFASFQISCPTHYQIMRL